MATIEKTRWDERQWQRIEEEYQEPAREVVRVMLHDMRLQFYAVAEVLWVSKNTLRKWCQLWSLETRRTGWTRKTVPSRINIRAQFLGYKDASEAVAVMRADGLRWEDIQLKLKCASSTISRFIPEAAKGHYNQTEAGRKAKQDHMYQLQEKMRQGEIERGGFCKNPLFLGKLN